MTASQPPSNNEPTPPPSGGLTLPMAGSFYLGMLFIALVWAAWTDLGLDLVARPPSDDVGLPWWLAGAGVGLLLVIGSAIAERLWPAMQELSGELRGMLGPRTRVEVSVLALLSGVVEEALFRGPVQHTLGYVLASVIFALIHGGPSRRYRAWTTFALVAGLSFGLLAEAYNAIWPSALAHVVVNAINLRRLTRPEVQERS
ncbi:MAG: CPBP family intramembrane metalloprotease [Myxococcales bacterium]|nr:CPBP family intramembrane metalloprotease [Myxococcales bacterium]